MAGEANGQTGGGKGNKTIVILLGVVIVLLVGVLGVFGAMLMKSNKQNAELQEQASEKQEKRSVVVSKDNAEEIVEQMAEQEFIEPGYYEASMTNQWHFSTGDAVSEDAYIANVETNTNDVYFDVVLADDEEHVIYKSPVIPRGGVLDEIKLDEDLEPGTYNCVLIYHLVDDDQNTVSTLRVTVTIFIEG